MYKVGTYIKPSTLFIPQVNSEQKGGSCNRAEEQSHNGISDFEMWKKGESVKEEEVHFFLH